MNSRAFVDRFKCRLAKDRKDKFNYKLGMYGHMLWEDIGTQVIPYDRFGSKERYTLSYDSEEDASKSELCAALGGRSKWDLKEQIEDFVREAAKDLVFYGRACYAVDYYKNESSRFHIRGMRPTDVLSIGQFSIVLTPHYKPWKHVEETIESKISSFKIPNQYSYVPGLLKKISKISPSELPSFAMDQYDPSAPQKYKIPVDFDLVRSTQEKRISKLCKDIGWSGRGLLLENMTEFYQLERQLRYEQFLLTLRGAAIHNLNQMLIVVDKKIDFGLRVKIGGFANTSDIESSREKLMSGSSTFAEVRAPYRELVIEQQ